MAKCKDFVGQQLASVRRGRWKMDRFSKPGVDIGRLLW